MATSKFLIYALQDPITFEIRYIGKSCSGLRRINRHFKKCEHKYDKNKRKINWIESLKKQKLLPNIVIIQEHYDPEILAKAEAYWIDYFHKQNCPLLNISLGGEQIRLSEETKRKLSVSIKRKFNDSEFKKRHIEGLKKALSTEQCKLNKSKSSKLMWQNPEYRKNISIKRKEFWRQVNKGEHGKLISEGKKKPIIDQYGTIYPSQKDACEILNIKRPDLCVAIKNNKPIKGFIFRKYYGN